MGAGGAFGAHARLGASPLPPPAKPPSPPGSSSSGASCRKKGLVRAKQVSGQSSSPWASVRFEPAGRALSLEALWGRARSTPRSPPIRLFLAGLEDPDVVLWDSAGGGRYDAVLHCEEAHLQREADGAAPKVVLDLDEDGVADLMLLDADADGRYDTVLRRDRSPLSFLAALSAGGAAVSEAPSSATPSAPRSESEASDQLRAAAAAPAHGAAPAAPAATGAEPLKPGWQRVWSGSHEAYYYWHAGTATVTWDPSEAVEETDARPLAPGWETSRSRESNAVYYRHPASGRTTWDASEARLGCPDYWKNALQTGGYLELVPAGSLTRSVQMLLASTFLVIRTRDRRTRRMPSSLEVAQIWRVEHSAVWSQYASHRARLKEARQRPLPGCSPPPMTQDLLPSELKRTLCAEANEAFLFHGTSPAGAEGIARCGFDLRRASAGTCYGPGVYLSECSSKSDEYAAEEEEGLCQGLCAMLLCRVALGAVLAWPHTTDFNQEMKDCWATGEFHSILGDRQQLRGTYREFVLPPESSCGVYPEYLIVYRRRFDD